MRVAELNGRPMDDEDGPRISRAIYQKMYSRWNEESSKFMLDLDSIAYALDDVAQEMRREGLPPSKWAQYVHFGL